MPEITYRLATPQDIPQMVELMNAQYTRKKTPAYFQWQYFEAHDPTVSWGAFSGNDLIGMFGLQKRQLESRGFVGQAIDLLVSPQWRGKGIFSSLACRAEEHFSDLDFFCVLPNSNGKAAVEKKLGFQTIAKINTMEIDAFELPEQVPDISSTLGLIESPMPEAYPLRFRYNDAFRQWRFDAHPLYHYRRVKSAAADFAVTKQFLDPVRGVSLGDIVDLSCDQHGAKQLANLFLLAATSLKHEGAATVTTWALPHTPLHAVLIALGFHDRQQERYLCVKKLPQCAADPLDITRWHLVEADAELF